MKSIGIHSGVGRVLLIAAVSGVIIAFAVYQGRAIVGRSDRPFTVASGGPVLEPLENSSFLRSYPVTFNGLEARFGHYASALKAREVVDEYARRLNQDMRGRGEGRAGSELPRSQAPAVASHGSGCSILSYTTEAKVHVGILAFDNPKTAGSDYFVGATAEAPAGRGADGDCPGREPPGVPKPQRSTRTLCVQNLGGVASVLNFYEVWGQPSDVTADLRQGLAEKGWTERAESSRTLSKNYDGAALLSFGRGREQCLVGIDQERKTGRIVILILWAERPWLPEGIAL